MRDTTKLYLFASFLYYPVIAISSFHPQTNAFGFILGGILLGLMFGMHKVFILQELSQKKAEQYAEMIEGMGEYLDECKKSGEASNIHVFDGKELKSLEDAIEESKQEKEEEEFPFKEIDLTGSVLVINDTTIIDESIIDRKILVSLNDKKHYGCRIADLLNDDTIKMNDKIQVKNKEEILFEGKVCTILKIDNFTYFEAIEND